MAFGTTMTTTITVRHPKNRMQVTPTRIALWHLKRDTVQALFRAPGNSKTHKVICFVNGRKCKLESISTDRTARFAQVK